MTFLPIVERELIEASRRRATYWLRLAIAAVGLILGGWIMLVMHRAPPGGLGLALFVAISIAACLYSLFIGVFRTADCLSEEKREGTLGLLFLTDLKGYDIVLGKLFATSLNAFYGILALFPVMAIPLLLGGVTLHEFWRVVLASLNILFFSLAVGMFCSAISRDERRAMAVALFIVLFFAAGLPLLHAAGYQYLSTRELSKFLLIPSPGYAAFMAFEAPFTKAPYNYFHLSMAVIHGLGWALLIASSFIVPRTWQDKSLSAQAVRRRERLNRLQLGSATGRKNFRARLLQINPFYWLVARHRMKPIAVWSFIAVGGLIWAIGLALNAQDWQDEGAYILTAAIAHTVIKFWLASEATRRFSLDRQSGALELLLSTPISVKEIVRGQWLGLERQFAGPVFVILLADFIFLLAGRNESALVATWIVGMVILVADLVTLAWLGMWRGLNSQHPNRAAAATLTRILFLPWGVFLLLVTIAALSDLFGFGGSSIHLDEKAPIILWGVVSLLVDVFFGFQARRNLLTRFRGAATQRFASRRS